MSHFSLNPQKPFPFFYTNHHHHPNDDIESDNSETASSRTSPPAGDRHHMFEKPLTPSDVGKLNRLVIPKQHAEKYFPPASAGDKSGTSAGGSGILLLFEDETGKSWRFRYSYWNSSQSYVLTKGWSRYVKEKKLIAGDVVLFECHRFETHRFFIGWRRRGSGPVQPGWTGGGSQRSSPLFNSQNYNVVPQQQQIAAAFAFPYQSEFLHTGTEVRHESQQKARKSSGGGNSKRVRLFGVNLECQLQEEEDNEEEPQTSDGSSLSSQGYGSGLGLGVGVGVGPTAYNYFDYVGYPPNHYNHMDINFPQDVNQMRNNQLG